VASLGLTEPGRAFHPAAYALIDLIRFSPQAKTSAAPGHSRRNHRAKGAGRSTRTSRGFIRAEVMRWDDLCKLAAKPSAAKPPSCAGGKE